LKPESYIESGILEAYVGGFLSDAENKEVDEMAEKYPVIKEEIRKIQATLQSYAQQREGLLNPPSLDSIVLKIAEEEGLIADARSKSFPWMKWALAAVISLLLLSTYLTFSFYKDSQTWKLRAEELREKNAYIQQQYSTLKQSPQVIEPHQLIIEDPASIPIIMTGTKPAPAAKVHVFWHSTSKDVYLVIDELPEPPRDHQYQLWAIIDGVSVDAGIFDHHTKMQKLRHIEGKVSAFAVTLEEKGGSPVPHLDQMYAKGTIKAT